MIRVVLADSQLVVREGLISIMQDAPDLIVVGSFGAGAELIDGLPACSPDAVIIETRLPDGIGTMWVQHIRKVAPEARVIVLTGSHADADLVLALEAGVDGYLSKDDSADDLLMAIRDAHADNFHVSPAAARQIRDLAVGSDSNALSPRELDVLVELKSGLTTSEIASKLCLSASTVKTHLGSIYRKLGARNRVEAMQLAERRGIVAPFSS